MMWIHIPESSVYHSNEIKIKLFPQSLEAEGRSSRRSAVIITFKPKSDSREHLRKMNFPPLYSAIVRNSFTDGMSHRL